MNDDDIYQKGKVVGSHQSHFRKDVTSLHFWREWSPDAAEPRATQRLRK